MSSAQWKKVFNFKIKNVLSNVTHISSVKFIWMYDHVMHCQENSICHSVMMIEHFHKISSARIIPLTLTVNNIYIYIKISMPYVYVYFLLHCAGQYLFYFRKTYSLLNFTVGYCGRFHTIFLISLLMKIFTIKIFHAIFFLMFYSGILFLHSFKAR